MQADMNAKKYFKCFELFYKTWKDLPNDMKIQYYDALMEYGLYWNLPDDPVIKSLLQGAIYSIDRADEKRKKKSDYMKGNSNAVKDWEKVSKQTKTDTDRNEQTETYEDKEDIEDKEEKKEKEKKKYLEFVYLTDTEYNKLIDSYGVRVIENEITNLNNYIWQNWKDKYKSHYHTILNRLRRAWVKEIQKSKQLSEYEIEEWVYDLDRLI